ncbi:hypothetical protein Tco_1363065 [Tanacetum coccineum]
MQNYTRYDAQSFYDAMIFNMDSLGKYMLELILHQQRTPQLLKQTKLMQTQEDHSHPIPALNVDSLKVDLAVIQNTCSEKEDSNSETASSKLVKECSLNSETKDVHAIKYKMSKAKERCMAYFRSLHSHLQVLSKDDLKGTHIEHGFRRAFMSIFGQDVDIFTRTMLLNVDQLQKQLDKDEFQEDRSMTAFWVVNNQFQKFIYSKFTLDYDSQMTDTYFVKYTRLEVQHFRDTLLQHLGNVKKSVAERTRHQRKYERRVNKRQMQTQESKIDTGKALDADLVDTESIRTDSTVQDDSSRSGNDTYADDADIRPIYDKGNGRVDQYPETCQVKSPMLDSSPDNQTTEYSKQSLESENILLNETETSNKAKIEKEIDVLETMNIELEHSVATLRHRFSIKKTSAVHEKTMTLRSCLRWKPTGKIFRTVGLRWVPTGKIFTPSTTKVDSEPPNGSNADITNQYESAQTLDVSAGTSNLSAVSTEVHQAAETVTTSNELDLLFGPLFDEYFNGENQVVLKSSAVTTTDASNKRQQQPDSTLSTSTLATTVTANGNFDLSYALSWKPCQGDSLNLPDHRAQVDQGSQIKMIQVKEMMQDNDLKNSKSKDKGSKSRSQSMDEQSHYKQDKTITRQSINVKRHIFNVIGGTEEFEERDLNIGGDC